MLVVWAIEIAHEFARERPVAYVCGQPARVLVAAGWNPALTPHAMEVWRRCQAGQPVEYAGFTGFPADSDDSGSGLGVLVVGCVGLDAWQRRDLLALAGMMERMNASFLANLLRRLKDGDPSARRDLHRVVRAHNYNVVQAARTLGMTRATLYKYLRRLRIPITRVPASMKDARQERNVDEP